jgi:hypothetical protein
MASLKKLFYVAMTTPSILDRGKEVISTTIAADFEMPEGDPFLRGCRWFVATWSRDALLAEDEDDDIGHLVENSEEIHLLDEFPCRLDAQRAAIAYNRLETTSLTGYGAYDGT